MAASRGADQVDLHSLQRLAPERWLNDQIINFVAKQIIQPATSRTYCYSSYFFSSLLHNSSRLGNYDFSQVHNWHNARGIREIGEIFSLRNLFVPINVTNSHCWILLQASVTEKKMYLYDSDERQSDSGNTNSHTT